ncbi:MAG: hypothetical protein KIT31_22775 [Deltaproteobacteria bacterium]|nr:hypothetical protein [Deltaproteobacteria bacterium]
MKPAIPFATAALFALTAIPAAAQPEPERSIILPGVFPTEVGGTFDARLDYTDLDDTFLLRNLSVLGLNFFGSYLTPGGFGGYAMLPVGYVSANGGSESAVGNLEVGGLYVWRKPATHFYLRGGVAVDTADNDGATIVPLANFVARPSDAGPSGLNTNWLRAHGGLRHRVNDLVFGATAGIDFALDRNSEDALLSLSGSIGIVQPGFSLAGGLTVLALVGDNNPNDDDSTITLNVTADFGLAPSARLYLTLGANLEDQFHGYSVGLGIRARL